jgi:hypothetical protein
MYQSVDFLCFHFIYTFLSSVYLYVGLKGLISILGIMPPINPTTRQSLRVPKLKEPEVGEGSSLGVAKQLEFSPRPEPVIKTSTKKAFLQPRPFGETEARTGANMTLTHCV